MEHEGCGHSVDKYISTFEVGEMSTGYTLEIQDLKATNARMRLFENRLEIWEDIV